MTTDTTLLIDEFVGVRAGTPYRLFPFGKIIKNGKVREVTPETAALFKLPHFKPAIKLGSHDDPTPAGGHIIALEVREDGLYAVPEWNEKGEAAMRDGAYRYHSPEVIWEDGALEDPASGELIDGPMLIGDALLHTPHLGEAAKLYGVEPIKKGEITMEETIQVPKNFFDKFLEKFNAQPEPQPEPTPKPVVVTETDEYKAVAVERDEYKAKWEAHEKEQARAVLVDKFEGELKETKADPELAELLADIPEETAEAVLKQFKALSAQIEVPALEKELGSDGEAIEDPAAAFNAAVLAIQAESNVAYNTALEMAKVNHKELFAAYMKAKE